jgi:hypothetical protein
MLIVPALRSVSITSRDGPPWLTMTEQTTYALRFESVLDLKSLCIFSLESSYVATESCHRLAGLENMEVGGDIGSLMDRGKGSWTHPQVPKRIQCLKACDKRTVGRISQHYSREVVIQERCDRPPRYLLLTHAH